jgi:hypothetical protein
LPRGTRYDVLVNGQVVTSSDRQTVNIALPCLIGTAQIAIRLAGQIVATTSINIDEPPTFGTFVVRNADAPFVPTGIGRIRPVAGQPVWVGVTNALPGTAFEFVANGRSLGSVRTNCGGPSGAAVNTIFMDPGTVTIDVKDASGAIVNRFRIIVR